MDFGPGDATLPDVLSSPSVAACAAPLRRVRPSAEAMRQVVLRQGGLDQDARRGARRRKKAQQQSTKIGAQFIDIKARLSYNCSIRGREYLAGEGTLLIVLARSLPGSQ